MALRYAILGMLSLGEHTGYELSKRFNGSVGFFWTAKHSQIYPELSKLLDDGCVACRTVEQDSRPNKKIYTVTEEGRARLRRWLEEPSEPSVMKDPLLLRAFCATPADRSLLVEQIEDALHAQRERLHIYQSLERELVSQGESEPTHPWFGGYLTLRYAMMQTSAYVAWCEWALERLQH